MEQTIALMIMVLMLSAAQPAKAQNSVDVTPQQQQEKAQVPSIGERFDECIGDENCTMRERMRLMGDMGDDMRETLWRMDRICAMMDYNECIGPQREEREQWHKMHSHMREMMQSMEDRSLGRKGNISSKPEEKEKGGEEMNKTEPSAGDESEKEEKRFWRWPKFW